MTEPMSDNTCPLADESDESVLERATSIANAGCPHHAEELLAAHASMRRPKWIPPDEALKACGI